MKAKYDKSSNKYYVNVNGEEFCVEATEDVLFDALLISKLLETEPVSDERMREWLREEIDEQSDEEDE